MPAHNLNTLPADILLLIAQYLEFSTVKSLALVDKQSNVATRNSLFQSITIKTPNLDEDIRRWDSILRRNSAFDTVRHLRIDGCHGNGISQVTSEQPEINFLLLINLISNLSVLTRVEWACIQQFPEPLLRLLEHQLPSCRLHLEIFRLWSLFDPSQEQYERSLISSRNLYAIRVPTDKRKPDHRKRILQHVIGVAQNLRRLERSPKGNSMFVSPQIGTAPPDEHPFLEAPTKQGRLEHLQYPTVLSRKSLAEWMEVTDLDMLRSLSFGNMGPAPDYQVFEYMQSRCNFASLDSLHLSVPPTKDDEVESALHSGARQFLCGLRALSALSVAGDLDCALLRPVLEHHGYRLRRLDLNPFVGQSQHRDIYVNHVSSKAADLSDILSRCPQLEELTIPIPRTCGDKDEVALYRAVGSQLPRLQRIDIMLDASDPAFYASFDTFEEDEQPRRDEFDEWDNEFLDDWAPEEGLGPRRGVVRQAFINSAVDRELVESIFWTIDGAKNDRSLPLEEAFFTIKPGGYTGDGVTSLGIRDLCRIVGKSWIVRRSPRDDRRHELDSYQWDGKDARISPSHGYKEPKEAHIMNEWDTIRAPFRKLWPALEGQSDGPENWKEEWNSFPLEI